MNRNDIFEKIRQRADFHREQDENINLYRQHGEILDLLDRMLLFNHYVGHANVKAYESQQTFQNPPYYMKHIYANELFTVSAYAFWVIRCATNLLEWEGFVDVLNTQLQRLEYLYSDTNLSFIEWIAKLNEVVGEANKSANQSYFDGVGVEYLADELIRVAAVAIRIIEKYLEDSFRWRTKERQNVDM